MVARTRKPRCSSKRPSGQSKPGKTPNLYDLISELHAYEPVTWVRTGIPAIDLIIGAGVPRGRFIEVSGDPATTKTGFALSVIAAFQREGGQAVLVDAESKVDKGFAENLGVDWDNIGYCAGATLEDVLKILGGVANHADPKIPTVIVWDSIAATPGHEEFDKAIKEGLSKEVAVRARYLSDTFRIMLNRLEKKRVLLLGVNQLRNKLNFGYGSSVDTPGGKAPKFHAAVRLRFKNRGRIKDRERDVVTGLNVEVECIKSNVAPPFRKATLQFRFDSGFVNYSGLDELLIRHGRLTSMGGWLQFRDKKFRATNIEQVAVEMPDLLNPLEGVIEKGPKPKEE